MTGPIASLFWLDSELCSDIHLDGMNNEKILGENQIDLKDLTQFQV